MKRWCAVTAAATGKVSIHTRHYWRVKPQHSSQTISIMMFQSTPAITGGLNTATDALLLMGKLFQSTPAITGG